MRAASFSEVPSAPLTRYPTLSTMRTRTGVCSWSMTVTASPGTNLGCVVMMVRPEPLWGSSSARRSRLGPAGSLGSTSCSINRAIKVLFPVRTGPTTPTYTSPSVLSAISLYRLNAEPFSMDVPPHLRLPMHMGRGAKICGKKGRAV